MPSPAVNRKGLGILMFFQMENSMLISPGLVRSCHPAEDTCPAESVTARGPTRQRLYQQRARNSVVLDGTEPAKSVRPETRARRTPPTRRSLVGRDRAAPFFPRSNLACTLRDRRKSSSSPPFGRSAPPAVGSPASARLRAPPGTVRSRPTEPRCACSLALDSSQSTALTA